MNDLTLLFVLIPGLMLLGISIALWLVVRQQRQIQRDIFGEQGVPLFAALFPTSRAGMRYHASRHGTDGSHHRGGHHASPHYSHDSWDQGDGPHSEYSGHGPSHDHGYSDSGSSSSSGSDSGSSSSSSDSSSSSSDSGSSSW
ncbi:hypothetical protein [Actinocorallia populi]|uniref:hypothetical protein n=1 Tax=Actinocorallia populi TaxID=2079200 RepID=UPI000D08EAAD|nr:hypothetical protein [Actinocorallia populi]